MAAIGGIGSSQLGVFARNAYQAKTVENSETVRPTLQAAYTVELAGKNSKTDPEIQKLKRTGQIECQTCKERKYQDGSNDPGVSFKAPGHISPESAGAVVMAHEQEHVANEQAKADKGGGKVVSQSVRIFTAVCPECGKVYVSGGETRTTTSTPIQSKQDDSGIGKNMDISV